MARLLRPTSVLIRDDFPTFERPTKAISATFEMPAPKPKPVEGAAEEVKKEEVKQ